jgi:3-oxoacyl-[acyl-carrier protein] reductase
MLFVKQAVRRRSVVPGADVESCVQRAEAPVDVTDPESGDLARFKPDDLPPSDAALLAEPLLGEGRALAQQAMQLADPVSVHAGIIVSPTYLRLTLRPMIDLSGKAAVVTGGSRGIGKAICLRLAQQGADVCFSYKGNAEAAAATVKEIEALGRRAISVQADVTQPEAAEGLIKTALDAFGKVDILVNNAGITRDDLIMRMSPDAWRDVLETNLFGAFWTLKAVTRPMLRARAGRIINITSVSGQAGQIGQANYSSAKAGLIGLTKASARELGSRGITVNAVAPGFVSTELTENLADEWKQRIMEQTPLGRFGTVEEVACAVAFLASDEAAYISGQVLAIDGGLVMM